MKQAIYNPIKAALAEAKIPTRSLRAALHKTTSTISTWCRNKRQPSLETLYEIADYIRVDVRELLEPNKNAPRKK